MEGKVNLRDSSNSCYRNKSDRIYHMARPYVHVLSGKSGPIQRGWMFDRQDDGTVGMVHGT